MDEHCHFYVIIYVMIVVSHTCPSQVQNNSIPKLIMEEESKY